MLITTVIVSESEPVGKDKEKESYIAWRGNIKVNSKRLFQCMGGFCVEIRYSQPVIQPLIENLRYDSFFPNNKD